MGIEKRRRKILAKQPKIQLVFDEKERKNYLTGFRKRKLERRRQAQQQLEKRLKDEKKKIKEMRKEKLLNMYYTTRDIPDITEIVEPKTYETANHTVTITSLTDITLRGANDVMLGIKNNECEPRKKDTGDDTDDGSPDEKQDDSEKASKPKVANDVSVHERKITKLMRIKQKLNNKSKKKRKNRQKHSKNKRASDNKRR